MSLLEKLKQTGAVKSQTVAESKFFSNRKDFVPTLVHSINVAFSGELDGGMVPGLTTIAGPSKHFKSSMGLVMVEAYLRKYPDAVCLFYDSEFGVTPEYLKTFGIDGERVLHIPIEHIEQLKFDIVKKLEEIKDGDHVIIFIDSVGNLASKKEAEDALEEKSVADMSRAKALKSLFRIITPHLTLKSLPCICINHVYQEMGMFPKAVVGGGCVLPETVVIMSDDSKKPISLIKPGEYVKTLLGPKEVEFVWDHSTLLNGTPECYEITFDDGSKVTCSDIHKFLDSNGRWIEAKNIELGQQLSTYKEFL